MKNAVFLQINSYNDLHILSWKYWCNKNDVDLVISEEPNQHQIKQYEKVALINNDVFIKWDAPNFFNLFEDDVCGVLDTSDFKKILTDIEKFNKNLNIDFYLQTDVLFFNSKYVNILENKNQISINYNISLLNKNPKIFYPCWNLYSIHIKDMFKHNWQLNRDSVPSFIKYAYIWNLNDLPKEHKNEIIQSVWSYIKNNYK